MLQALRDKSSGWIATIILVLLMVPFAFFGMEQYLFQRTIDYAAKIEAPPTWWRSAPDWWIVRRLAWQKEEITPQEFRQAFEQARQQRRQAEGENFDARRFETMENKLAVLDRLIDQRVMKMVTERSGLAVGNKQVVESIRANPAFHVDGNFDMQRYRMLLASSQPPLTPTQYDEIVRGDLQQSLLATRLSESAFLTPSEGKRIVEMYGERRDVSFVVLPPPPQDTAPVTPAEIAAWYKANQNNYRAPETVTLEYIEVDGNALPLPQADEAALRERYEQEKSRFVEPEQRLTSHILIKVDAGADAAADAAARAKAEGILAEARAAGADFAAIARRSSEDAGSKDTGGDLGWVQKGAMGNKPFEDALFAMNAGEIRGPVKSEFGWHVIQVREIKPGREMPFEQARPEVERLFAESARERAFNDLTGKVVDEAMKTPTSLTPAAKVANLQVQRIGPFARGQGTGIAADPNVQREAFSDDAKRDRMASNAIEIGQNRSVLIRVVDSTPEQVQPLSQVGARVVAEIRADRVKKAAKAEAAALLARLQKGESIDAVAAARQLQVNSFPGVPRNAPMPDPAAAMAYFEVPAPAPGKVSPGKADLPDGSYVLFVVTKATPGAESEVPAEQRKAFFDSIAPRAAEQDVSAIVAEQRKRMKIERIEQQL